MNTNLIIDRRQFIIMSSAYERTDFYSIEIGNNLILSYHKELRVLVKDNCVLLGEAIPVINGIDGNIKVENTQYWCGRWILIEDNKLYLDANGTLGIYYYVNENSQIYISSSLHLLSKVLNIKWNADYYAESGKDGIIDYYPIPCTPYSEIKKLLPSQGLTLEGKVFFRTDYMIPRYQSLSVMELESSFIEGMKTFFKGLQNRYGDEIWISLTGGYDSRVGVAIAKSSGVSFHVYTALRDTLHPYDIIRAKEICRALNIEHETIDDRYRDTEESRMRESMFDTHCGGHITFGTEKKQVIANSDVPAKKQAVVLWGTLWAVTYKAYANFMDDALSSKDCYREICKWSDALKNSTVHKESIREWSNWCFSNKIEGMDWRQRLYWEQRNGAWVSAAQQGLDLLDSIRISPINCQYLIELLLSYPEKYQHDKKKQGKIVNRCCPELKKIPYGEKRSIRAQLMRKGKNLFIDRIK